MNLLNFIKNFYQKNTVNVILNENLNVPPTKIRKKMRISTLITIFNTILEVLGSIIMQEKEIKGAHLEKK